MSKKQAGRQKQAHCKKQAFFRFLVNNLCLNYLPIVKSPLLKLNTKDKDVQQPIVNKLDSIFVQRYPVISLIFIFLIYIFF